MEFYAGCARKNVMAPGMNLDYGNARQRSIFFSLRASGEPATLTNPRKNVFLADLDLEQEQFCARFVNRFPTRVSTLSRNIFEITLHTKKVTFNQKDYVILKEITFLLRSCEFL